MMPLRLLPLLKRRRTENLHRLTSKGDLGCPFAVWARMPDSLKIPVAFIIARDASELL